MKRIEYDKEKDTLIKKNHGISFEQVISAIKRTKNVVTIEHPNKQKYGHQKIFLVEIGKYIFVIPYVEDEEKIFLKTAFPSRKYTKIYLKKEK
ncbi:toxin [Candidatus Gottesmanbacteria bacterium]|nr:toxin [Candidatus Gottesmanbacteria bacterium]MBI5452850.1 toxin [Candidatus Gottesmanbacteria bacterium]